jgi:hypothetical protein
MLNSVTVLARQEVPEEPAPAQASEATAVAIYQVEGGKIVNVWFVR